MKTKFLLTIFLTALFARTAVCSGSNGGDVSTKKQMNVLFLMVDDLNTWLLSNPDRYTGKVIAPNILRLAKSGVSFGQAFAASPKCSPSRTALLSGVAPWKSGVYDNGVDVNSSPALQDVPSLPKVFQQAGYYNTSFGRLMHFPFGMTMQKSGPLNRDRLKFSLEHLPKISD